MPTAVPAVIGLDFPPVLDLGALAVPLRALGLAVAVALALGWFARRVRSRGGSDGTDAVGGRTLPTAGEPPVPTGDIAFVVLAAIPGAVVGGRVVHGLVHAAAYAAEPGALLDLGRGSLSLAGAVIGGALTAGWLCSRLGYRARAWADAAAAPLLLAIGGGKLAMLLGGAGQGLPWAGRGGIALLGDGPWASLDPALPAYPTQVLEGCWALLGIPVVLSLERRMARREVAGRRPGGRGRVPSGTVAFAATAWWLLGRALVAVWWRDEPVLGPLGAEAMVALAALGGCLALLAIGATHRAADASGDSWMT